MARCHSTIGATAPDDSLDDVIDRRQRIVTVKQVSFGPDDVVASYRAQPRDHDLVERSCTERNVEVETRLAGGGNLRVACLGTCRRLPAIHGIARGRNNLFADRPRQRAGSLGVAAEIDDGDCRRSIGRKCQRRKADSRRSGRWGSTTPLPRAPARSARGGQSGTWPASLALIGRCHPLVPAYRDEGNWRRVRNARLDPHLHPALHPHAPTA